ncbi:MAG: preprotein translocase subunit SecA [Cyanobacteria bacterium]|nr:preprotein translocase subunit SecA [Cyanobacteria bacterium CG_2015-16_32_12]NCO78514.1 preprotein translocase subunit SecA [Cyanobacteria bacterium CG_2015-22_32_23]NCQ04858.1 preprotein translocase subunit SecA [Cyanobacteria bacterium CG_2015-09_32_10]NCS85631.1 preprotein translocase subunit SecA [Cyanobacteria bacterium CG_2015-02_32_10]
MFKKLFGDPNARKLKKLQPLITEINLFEEDFKKLSDEEMRAKTASFKQMLAKAKNREERDILLDEILVEAFALVREAGIRVLGMRHYDVQMLGGIVLHTGQIAEMKTGEGKTLVATLPAYLNGLTGKGVHVVTVNDYLARRDAEWMGQIHRFLGLSVGLIQSGMTSVERQKNYNADITYATNSELGFDYLRDNMATDISEVVQRVPNYCIIDEVDSILVDEARTPLIISGQVERPMEKYMEAARIAQLLTKQLKEDDGGDYEVDEKARSVLLTDEGFAKAEELLGVKDLYDQENPWAHYIFNAIKAKELFTADVNYIVRNNEVVIVDEFTGRVLAGRRWSDGLHQAIEAKENVEIQKETQTLASITYQNFFLLYPKLSGMTGTAKTEETEFEKVYKLEVSIIPTNRPSDRADLPDVVYKNEIAKWKAVAEECHEMHETGRPVLIGTTSVEKSELLAKLLVERKIPHQILNARPENVERESEIVAQAGRKGAITIATNMAGRGTDIILGGNSDYMARLKIREYLMPQIVTPEDDQFMVSVAAIDMNKRPKPQGFSGNGEGDGKKVKNWKPSSDIFPCQLSPETETKLKEAVKFVVETYGQQSLSELDAEEKIAIAAEKAPTEEAVILKLREVYRSIRQEYDALTDKEHELVVEKGGLHVIGTERHESRRIDNQLRGRAGRQGDPGSTRFFLSLEDNLLRIFGGDRVAGLMNAFRVEEDMPIESGMLTRSLEGAQKKVETFYYDARKSVFEYDEVMNNQRRAIYAERRRVLEGRELKEQVLQYATKTTDEIIDAYVNPELPPDEWNLEGLVNKAKEFIYLLEDVSVADLEDMTVTEMKTFLQEEVHKAYDLKEHQIEQLQAGLMRQAERFFILQQIDTLWREHLQAMDGLRESVGLRGYGQKDPLIEYKQEGYEMFLEMMIDIRRNVVYSLFQFQPQSQSQPQSV